MRLHRTLAAAVLAVALASSALPAAQADTPPPTNTCQFSDGTLSRSELTVGTTHSVSVEASIRVTGCDVVSYYRPNLEFGYPETVLAPSDLDPTLLQGTLTIEPGWLSNDAAGQPSSGTIYLGSDTYSFGDETLTLLRKSRLDVGELPSKIKKNKKFYFGAFLDRADWDGDYYTSYEGKKVSLQTSESADGKYKTIKTIKSMRGQNGGFLPATAKLKKKTCFRWVFEGSSTTSAVTADAGCVKIK